MEWSWQNDVLLCTEIRVREPYKFKKCSNERGKIWTETPPNIHLPSFHQGQTHHTKEKSSSQADIPRMELKIPPQLRNKIITVGTKK